MKTNRSLRLLGLSVAGAMAAATTLPYAATAATAPATLSLVATSQDGGAFDVDEYGTEDIAVQVTSSRTGPVDVDDAQDLAYSWTVKPFGAATTTRVPATGADTQSVEDNGRFVVALPTSQGPGTYALSAGLGSNAAGANAIRSAVRLSVKVGNAALTFDDSSPLQAAAGGDHAVSGTLRLEDGTGLAARSVDVAFTRGSAGSDPEADAGFPSTSTGSPTSTATQVTTGPDGAFEVSVSDPAEEGQGTELGGGLHADTALTPNVGNADAGSALAVDLVGEALPAGSTVVLDDLAGGIPGEVLSSKLTITAPDDTYDVDPSIPGVQGDGDTDRDPVNGQTYSLKLDHGFFTDGEAANPPVAGDRAGDLVELGAVLTGLADSNGEVPFQVGIARDEDFDDDGFVTATVEAAAGALTTDASAEWDATTPLNGKVAVALSPAAEQDAAVDPTLAGNRAYYEIFTLDQFGNRVGDKPVDLTYSGNLDDWDYSDDFVTSDYDTSGDIWLTSFEAASIKVTGTWQNAPTYEYLDSSGTTTSGTKDAKGSATADFYELDFDASEFSITSTATDVVAVGSTATQTVRVIDQRGNPVRGYEVRFFRFGPDTVRGEAVATRETNRRGEASYTFVGTALGRAKVTAEVTDGIRSRLLTQNVVFGSPITARLAARRGASDAMRVSATRAAAGARVEVSRVVAGRLTPVGVGRLSRTGKAYFRIRDRNGLASTTYVAVVRSTARTVADQSNTVNIR